MQQFPIFLKRLIDEEPGAPNQSNANHYTKEELLVRHCTLNELFAALIIIADEWAYTRSLLISSAVLNFSRIKGEI